MRSSPDANLNACNLCPVILEKVDILTEMVQRIMQIITSKTANAVSDNFVVEPIKSTEEFRKREEKLEIYLKAPNADANFKIFRESLVSILANNLS